VDSERAERNLKLTIEYDGTSFHGWQSQPGLRTVQGTLAEVMGHLTGEAAEISGASRTDRGVHALGQVATWRTRTPIPEERLARVLNGLLPEDIRIRQAEEVEPGFHARFSALAKRYSYLLDRRAVESVFVSRRALHYPDSLDVGSMREAASVIVGEHDFAAFRCSSGREEDDAREPTIRTIYRVDVEECAGLLSVVVLGRSFLYKMVRTIVGSLLEVGRGKWSIRRLAEGMASLDRRRLGPTLPPKGLCLEEVYYDQIRLDRAIEAPAEQNPGQPKDPRNPFSGSHL